MNIKNNRSEKDHIVVNDILYSGGEQNNADPKILNTVYSRDNPYGKKGDKYNCFCISGGENGFFEAKMIEFYGIS